MWSGIVTMHMTIATPATSAPANALTSAEAIGWAEPITAPNSPAMTARALQKC